MTPSVGYNRSFVVAAFLLLCCATIQAPHVVAQDQLDKERAEETLKFVTEKASQFEFYMGDDRQTKLKMVAQSVLHWSNPVSTALYGEVFLWTESGRPEVIAAMYKFYQPDRRHTSGEFHSLALSRVTGMQGGREVWTPAEPGITLAPFADAPAVALNASLRLAQMRAIARRFSAEASDRYEPEQRERLRLLPKPIYRYEPSDPALLDGAIFAFVQGTNPEVLLLLEARRTGDEYVWQYGLARFNSVALQVSYNEREVWRVPQTAPPWENVRNPQKPYFVHVLDPGE